MDGRDTWPAPAKLNLMLRIVDRREDGYHELQTVFQFLEFQDQLRFDLRQDQQILFTTPTKGIPPEQDLIVRAARLLQQKSRCRKGIEIQLDKKLPLGGGLGGGSSDAATTLVALNHIWQTDLSSRQLAELGLSLGADVPIFIHGVAAWGEGIGEELTDLDLPEPWYLVLVPECQVSTREIFTASDLTRNSPRIKIRDFELGDRANDCLPIVRKRYPEVNTALTWLEGQASAQLTGTGACVFAEFPDKPAAEATYRDLPEELHGFVAKGLNRSPLLDRLKQD